MKKLELLLSGLATLVLTGCFAAPQMRMDVPEDSTSYDYNGFTVRMHSIGNGDFGKTDSDSSSAMGDLADLVVDTLPNLEYRIGPLDVVQVVVWEHPELTSPMGQYQPGGQRVTTDGKLFYPYAGELEVQGLTAQELRDVITKRLSDKVLNNPQVDVRVTGYNSRRAFVVGAVGRPGFVAFDEKPMTIPDAIAGVGGFESSADPSAMQLRRGNKVYNIDYLNAFNSNMPLERMLVQPNDQIFVPTMSETQKDQKVFVLGEVQRVGVVQIQRKLSLAEALSSAGGLNALNASSHSIYVIRNTGDKQIDVYNLDAKNALSLAMAERFDMNPSDIVYVDASGLATWNRLLTLLKPNFDILNNAASIGRNVQLMTSNRWTQATTTTKAVTTTSSTAK